MAVISIMIQAPGEREIAGKSLSTLLANLGNTVVEHSLVILKSWVQAYPKLALIARKFGTKFMIFDQTLQG